MEDPKNLYQDKYDKALKIVEAYRRVHSGAIEEAILKIFSDMGNVTKYNALIKLINQSAQDMILLEKAQIHL